MAICKNPYVISLFLLLPAAPVGAQGLQSADLLDREEEEEGEERPWSLSAELGAVIVRGNSDTDSYNAKLGVGYEVHRWRHRAQLEALGASDDGATTAERYLAGHKSDYKLSERDYLFGALRWEKDRFSGYEYQISEALGYGRRLILTERHRLDAEIGPGARQSKVEGEDQENELIGRLGVAYRWSLSETSAFSEDLIVQSGESNTQTESVTALKLKINSRLAMKLSYTVKHNSDVPPEADKTDTTTAITLVYDY